MGFFLHRPPLSLSAMLSHIGLAIRESARSIIAVTQAAGTNTTPSLVDARRRNSVARLYGIYPRMPASDSALL
jgi:hypothetical protein